MVVTLGQQYNVGEKPTVILYTYINHTMHSHQTEQNRRHRMQYIVERVVIIYVDSVSSNHTKMIKY